MLHNDKKWIYQKDITVLYVYTPNHKFTPNIHQDHFLGHKMKFKTFKRKLCIVFLDQNRIKLEMNNRNISRKICKYLEMQHLINLWVQKSSLESRKYLDS